MISEPRLRAHLLQTLHGLRDSNTGWVPVSDMNFGGLEIVSFAQARAICEQLADGGLAHFKPLPGNPCGFIVGLAKITGHGCDVVDGRANSQVTLEFPQNFQSRTPSLAVASGTPRAT